MCDTSSSVYGGGGQPRCDTLVMVYDGGGQPAPETQPEEDRKESIRFYTIRVDRVKKPSNKGQRDKLKLCTAATQA